MDNAAAGRHICPAQEDAMGFRSLALLVVVLAGCASEVGASTAALEIDLGTGTYEGDWIDDSFHTVPRPLTAHALARFELPRCGLIEASVRASSRRVSDVDQWSLTVSDGAADIGSMRDGGVSGDALLAVDATGGSTCTAIITGPGAPRHDLLWSLTVSP